MIYKIPHQSYTLALVCLIFFNISSAQAQSLDSSKYGTPVINKISQYQASVAKTPQKKMIELKSVVAGISYDLRYASKNNFVGKRMYPANTSQTFMRQPAATALGRVQEELMRKGYSLKVYDAYRPYSITVDFWELIKDERYVAHPAKGSGHNRGLAIDCTIINIQSGKELDMGTGFDNFTDTAHHTFTSLPEEVLKNRKLFKEVMLRHGFQLFETEWWHYFWPNDLDYEVLDIPFNQLAKSVGKR